MEVSRSEEAIGGISGLLICLTERSCMSESSVAGPYDSAEDQHVERRPILLCTVKMHSKSMDSHPGPSSVTDHASCHRVVSTHIHKVCLKSVSRLLI